MKTPEEIKKGLECCVPYEEDESCAECPYKGEGNSKETCYERKNADTLAYIEQLEREKAALLKALKDADVYGECENCKYRKDADDMCVKADYFCVACLADCKCKTCLNGSNWEWIGVQEVE